MSLVLRHHFWYSVIDDGPDRYRAETYRTLTPSALARETSPAALCDAADDAAMDFHSNHDGWEAHWPLTFAIFATEDGAELGRCEVERELEPSFHARLIALPPHPTEKTDA